MDTRQKKKKEDVMCELIHLKELQFFVTLPTAKNNWNEFKM